MMRVHFITVGPEIQIRQKVRWISYGTSRSHLKQAAALAGQSLGEITQIPVCKPYLPE